SDWFCSDQLSASTSSTSHSSPCTSVSPAWSTVAPRIAASTVKRSPPSTNACAGNSPSFRVAPWDGKDEFDVAVAVALVVSDGFPVAVAFSVRVGTGLGVPMLGAVAGCVGGTAVAVGGRVAVFAGGASVVVGGVVEVAVGGTVAVGGGSGVSVAGG